MTQSSFLARVAWVVGLVLLAFIASLRAQIVPQVSSDAPAPAQATTPPAQAPGVQVPSSVDPAPTSQGPPEESTAGQDGPDSDAGTFVFKKQVEEVVLHATVVDGERRLITNLDRTTFAVFENGVPQSLTSFRREDVPVAIGVLIDNSGSMRAKRDKVNQAVLNLVRASNPQDEVFVVNFSDWPYLDQDFTSDVSLLQQALQKISDRGKTALYDAIVAAANHLSKSASLEKKVLLVVTDGADNASQQSLQEAAQRLQKENGPTLYAIGLMGESPRPLGVDALRTLAASTGGVAYFPQTLDEVGSIAQAVAHDIRNQYTIGYKPAVPQRNGGYRSIKVEAVARGYKQLTVHTRTGYYAGDTAR